MKELNPEHRMMSTIKRWGIIPHIKEQNIAEHSYYVAYYCDFLSKGLKVKSTSAYKLLLHALMHDRLETWTGDIPGPIKSKGVVTINEELILKKSDISYNVEPLNDIETKIFKLADLMDQLYYSLHEVYLGNKHFEKIFIQIRINCEAKTLIFEEFIKNDFLHNLLHHFRTLNVSGNYYSQRKTPGDT